jgi:hypothetical protein
MATGVRKGGGAKIAIKSGKGGSTLRKPKGLKADANYKAKSIHSSSNKQGILGKVAQKRETRRIMQEGAKKMGISPKPARKLLQAKTPANVMGRKFGKIQKTSTVTMADSARITKMIGRMDRKKAASVTGRTREQAKGAMRARMRRTAEWGEFSRSLNPKVGRNSTVNSEGRYGFSSNLGRAVVGFKKSKQPNLFGGVDTVRNKKARYIGERMQGAKHVIRPGDRSVPFKKRGKPKPRPYGSR